MKEFFINGEQNEPGDRKVARLFSQQVKSSISQMEKVKFELLMFFCFFCYSEVQLQKQILHTFRAQKKLKTERGFLCRVKHISSNGKLKKTGSE